MIDRYSLSVPADKLSKHTDKFALKGYIRSCNIHPLKKASILINQNEENAMVPAVWGLMPHFSKDLINRGNLFNASVDGIVSKPSFRISIRQRRCLIPADSYYIKHQNSWHRVMKRDKSVMLLAGLYDVVQHEAQQYVSFSMITVPPNRDLVMLKNPMPVDVCLAEQDNWLGSNTCLSDVLSTLKCSDSYQWIHYPIKNTLEDVNYDAPDIQDEFVAERTLFSLA